MGRGAQDRAMQLMSKNQGWDPTEIVGDSYDAEKANASRFVPGDRKYGDSPGPDSGPKTMADLSISMDDNSGIQFAEERPSDGSSARMAGGGNARHYPGKPQ